MSNPAGLVSAVTYRDPKAALAWLEAAFGFDLVFLIEGADASVAHAEMSHGASRVMIGGEWSTAHASPASLSGKTTQTIHVYIEGDVDAQDGLDQRKVKLADSRRFPRNLQIGAVRENQARRALVDLPGGEVPAAFQDVQQGVPAGHPAHTRPAKLGAAQGRSSGGQGASYLALGLSLKCPDDASA